MRRRSFLTFLGLAPVVAAVSLPKPEPTLVEAGLTVSREGVWSSKWADHVIAKVGNPLKDWEG